MLNRNAFARLTARTLLIVTIGLVAGYIGTFIGEKLGYGIARLTNRDPAELKDLLIWCFIATPMVFAAGGLWLGTTMVSSGRFVQRAAATLFGGVGILCLGIGISSYDWPKSSGFPVIDYEMLFPENMEINGPGDFSLSIWNGQSGRGCYIGEVKKAGSRSLASGTIVLGLDYTEPTMSLELREGHRWTAGGRWPLPYRPDAKLETAFTPWIRIDFSGSTGGLPTPSGPFDIRYRLRRYM